MKGYGVVSVWDNVKVEDVCVGLVFFFKQKTAYEISACLVGSEMCIRDRFNVIAITNWLHARFPNRIEEHYIGYYKDRNEARNNRTKTRDRLIDKHKASGILTGMTLNPSELLIEGRDESRDKKREIRVISSHGVYHYRPFINSTKQTVAELYNEHNLQDLANLTISCESESLPRPCKECWWCKEKYWAFGYY